jgi:hypothetical protein
MHVQYLNLASYLSSLFQGILVAGGTGPFEDTSRSVEFLRYEGGASTLALASWNDMAQLVHPRCCWPQLGQIGGHWHLIGGESEASDSMEVMIDGDVGVTWREAAAAASATRTKRERMRAVFVKAEEFPKCKLRRQILDRR